MESIGQILKAERERRELSLQDVHEATKITVHNIEALEQDSFDYFPNKVYARAFLRDYANFLGLNSTDLLVRYEDEWGTVREPARPAPPKQPGWRPVLYPVAAVAILGALIAAGYFGWSAYGKNAGPRVAVSTPSQQGREGATLPAVDRLPSPRQKPEPAAGSAAPPQTQPQPEQPAAPEKLVLEVKTKEHDVWINIIADGQSIFQETVPPGQTKTFEAAKKIKIIVGLANGVELKLNGEPLPSMGTHSGRAEAVFVLPELPAAEPETAGASSAPPAPAAEGSP